MSNYHRPALGAAILLLLISVILSPAAVALSQSKRRNVKKPLTKTVASNSTEASWHIFRGPDGDFTLDFPREPKRVEDVQGPVTVLRRFALTAGGYYFEVSVQDTGGDPDSREANELSPRYEEGVARLLAEDGIKIVQTRRLSKSSYEMELLSPALTPGQYLHGLRRGVIRRGRHYHLGCDFIIPGREVDRRVCRRFLTSFRLTTPAR